MTRSLHPELVLILNTHMPKVLGQGELFDEPENWLFEAITETYIPLIQLLSSWDRPELSNVRIILSMTPCLVKQLQHCRARYLDYLLLMEKITQFEVERTTSANNFNRYEKNKKDYNDEQIQQLHQTAELYLARILNAQAFIHEHNIIDCIAMLSDRLGDRLQLWTSTPNHNFLPFFNTRSCDYFVKKGVDLFEHQFNQKPAGFWLPECAFMPGIENNLKHAGIARTALAVNAIEHYHPGIKSGRYEYDGLELFVHDFRLSMHIWQAPEDTLLSNPIYREFYRDMGMDVVASYFDELGIRVPNRQNRVNGIWTSIKYHAGSGVDVELGEKILYDSSVAYRQAELDAHTFWNILDQKRTLTHDGKTCITAFDTEIFGHWWLEGIPWLQHMLAPRT